MKKLYFILGILALLSVPGVLRAQEPEAQTGDTTYYKTLIPEKNRLSEKHEHDRKHAVCIPE